MKIVVAGASGVIGRALVPLLVKEGHEVVGLTRNRHYAAELSSKGVQSVILDVFDREAVFSVLRETKPDTVIHQLTSLSARDFAEHARIRKEGTRNLVDASLEAGVRRMIAQSISWAYSPGEGPAVEDNALDLEAPLPRKTTVESVHALESAVAEMPEHVILRYGLFYGAGTWYASGGFIAEQVRQQQLPATEGISSFVHVDDAAHAAVLALHWPSGPFNIVDNEPAPGTEWLPIYADALGAPAPAVEHKSTRWERGAVNDKALQYGWKPRYASWREGFRHALGSL
ncbi:NAD-dependent epimerase/dehydratase family protein [Aneurinibacillus migulanus]|uniref:Nucleoside-diphosphate-sugar epimerase n=1 Tax=Aneurinibacillus migulanus TaxID=47500 RepID=A0A0D1XVS8_ANEMI|nr:NAD(P)-dependent oxidoreductase [Aneurinibacillus migulanus]KIV58301.1 dTDP-glucose 4,6-dehydratase [Aneurinibacillus migulanus]KON95970.1 dTDP-glucose 4,6-dehydratase [Aneurinibacillus migulanus]MED0896531.1 NAD(P)-dependent oxidoreductase [Aneurinibacillus migulanus]MED1616528.1 NAD(P)-dependent oxidoreductase [Aneurinibacillus migulanus]SDJ18437.1 Nucleoside-diphosphate-sugar epimerase [Aneurinibacillus migulanus]